MIGAILAGGSGRRMGGSKAARLLGGRPLIEYPASALAEVCERVVVLVKAGTDLGDFAAPELWVEDASPQHPLTGLVHALERAGEAVMVCAADMPFITAEACRTLLGGAAAGRTRSVVAVAGGIVQPVFGVYTPSALATFRAAAPSASLTEVVEALGPTRVAIPPPLVRSINTPEELSAAEHELRGSP
ncbi:MAG: molybdenum cofactor guanylyltransferase [Thermoleophilaceae bacterium]